MTEINVSVWYLQNLSTRARGVSDSLRAFAVFGERVINSSPDVDSAYGDLGNRWDQRRNELADALRGIADGLDTTARAFEQTDIDLAAVLNTPPGQP